VPGTRIMTVFTDSDLIRKDNKKDFFFKAIKNTNFFKHNEIVFDEKIRFNVFDARTYWSLEQYGDGWIKIGDASYSIDPLSGKGIEKNFGMIEFLIKSFNPLGGINDAAMTEYKNYNQNAFNNFLTQKKNVYKFEKRWCNEPFWRRRI